MEAMQHGNFNRPPAAADRQLWQDFLYTTQEDVACVPRHRIRMSEPVRPACLLEAVKTALLRFPHMMLGLAATETQYRYRLLVEEPVVLPF